MTETKELSIDKMGEVKGPDTVVLPAAPLRVLAVLVAIALTTKVSRVLLFWIAFILTRPFGATLGNFLTKSKDEGGLDFGTIGASAILAVILVIFIVGTTIKGRRAMPAEAAGV